MQRAGGTHQDAHHTVFVFEKLSADFLLGTNALRRNGCVIDCNVNRLYVANDHGGGAPLRSTPCDTCAVAAVTATARPCGAVSCGEHEAPETNYRIVCDADSCRLVVIGEVGSSTHMPSHRDTNG